MSNNALLILIGIAVALFLVVVIAFLAIRKRSQNSDVQRIQNLRKGTEHKDFSWDVFYQKLYVKYVRTPFVSLYLFIMASDMFVKFIKLKGVVNIHRRKYLVLGIIAIVVSLLLIFNPGSVIYTYLKVTGVYLIVVSILSFMEYFKKES